jgi:hypothetical protein
MYDEQQGIHLGILDQIDLRLGRFSDSDGSGKRRRSFGATTLFWLCLPMIFLIGCVGVATIISALSGRPLVPKELIESYNKCLAVAKKKAMCKLPAVTSGKTSKVELGWGPWAGAALLVVIGFLLFIWRRKQDFERFKQTAETLSVFVTKEQQVPNVIIRSFEGLAEKMIGALPEKTDEAEEKQKEEKQKEEKQKEEIKEENPNSVTEP